MFAKAMRSELFRIGKMKCTYILPVVLAGLILLTNFIYTRIDLYGLMGYTAMDVETIQEMGTSAEGFEESFMTGFRAGLESSKRMEEDPSSLQILGEGPFYNQDVAVVFSLDTGSLYSLLLLAIFTGLYIGTVYSTGIDKNLNIFAGKRGLLMRCRLLLIALYTLFIHLFTWLMAIVSMALMGSSVRLMADRSFVLYFIVTWLLTVSFTSIVASVTHLTRSKAAGITLGIILSAGILSTIMSVASLILQKLLSLGDSFNLGNYTVTQNIASLTLFSDGHTVVRAIVCAILYFAFSYVLSSIAVKKRDIA